MDPTKNIVVKDSRRWVVMLAFAILNFSNAIGYVNINSIAQCAASYYSQPINLMLTVVNSSNLIFIVIGWLAIPLLNWRLDYTIVGGAILSCASYWMRFLAHHSFFAALIGSVLNSIAQIVILPACIYLPEVWFPIEERNIAFGVPFYFNMLGLNFGYIFPAEFVGDNCDRISYMQFICSIISTLGLLICVLLIRNKPKSPTNKKSLQVKRPTWKKSFQFIFCNGQNLFHISVMSIFLGLSWSIYDVIGTAQLILGFIFGAFNYDIDNNNTIFTTEQIGLLCVSFSVSGIVFGFLSSFHIMQSFVNHTKPKVDIFIKVYLGIGFLSLIALSVLVAVNNETYLWYVLVMIVCGAGFNGFIPSACQSLVENLFPVRELVTATVFFVFASVFAQCITGISQLNIFGDQGFVAICFSVLLPLIYVIVCYKTEFKRHEFSEYRQKKEDIKLEMVSNDEAPIKIS